MKTPENWHDMPEATENKVVLTQEQLHIPGIRMFAHCTLHNAMNSLEWHYHDHCFEFSIPKRGAFSFSTENEDYPFSGGEVFVSFPDEVHGTNQIPVTVGELYWFQLDISDAEQFLFLKEEAATELIGELKRLPGHVIKTEFKKSIPLIEKAFLYAQNNTGNQLVASFLQFFLHILVLESKKEPFQVSDDIQNVLEYIQDNITSELSLEYLASIANLSCSQFKQKFKKQLGTSPRNYINQQKIEYSKQLLLEGKSITDTAMLLNFTTSNYFSTVFKKYTLYTPKEYTIKNTP